jgi:hypothetical protein
MHGPHGSDHHLMALAASDGAGLHHASWDVGSFDDIGLGSQQMSQAGYSKGWGLGRHVLGSNYFRYVRDPGEAIASIPSISITLRLTKNGPRRTIQPKTLCMSGVRFLPLTHKKPRNSGQKEHICAGMNRK